MYTENYNVIWNCVDSADGCETRETIILNNEPNIKVCSCEIKNININELGDYIKIDFKFEFEISDFDGFFVKDINDININTNILGNDNIVKFIRQNYNFNENVKYTNKLLNFLYETYDFDDNDNNDNNCDDEKLIENKYKIFLQCLNELDDIPYTFTLYNLKLGI